MEITKQFISDLKKKKIKSFDVLFSHVGSKMRSVCYRYISNKNEADDILQDAFMKVFNNIDQFNSSGPLEAWIRRIVVNTALQYCIDKNKHNQLFNKDKELDSYVYHDEINDTLSEKEQIMSSNISMDDILFILSELPEHYRIVFNLFVIDEYKHQEIAKILNIPEETSKTRLLRARKLIKERLLNDFSSQKNNYVYESR